MIFLSPSQGFCLQSYTPQDIDILPVMYRPKNDLSPYLSYPPQELIYHPIVYKRKFDLFLRQYFMVRIRVRIEVQGGIRADLSRGKWDITTLPTGIPNLECFADLLDLVVSDINAFKLGVIRKKPSFKSLHLIVRNEGNF